MAQSVEQWMPIAAMPALCEVPVIVLPVFPVETLELDAAQRPESVTADRWTVPDSNLIPALFPR